MMYGAFASSIQGLLSQSQAMQVIGLNVANVNTGGYKRSQVEFSTLVGKTMDAQSDIGGVKPNTRQLVRPQGHLVSSDSDLDLAINGHGFFVLNSQLDGSGDTLYGRDGTLRHYAGDTATYTDPDTGETTSYQESYLIDKNGHFLQGYGLDANDQPTGALGPLRVDPYVMTDVGQATTSASLGLNLPATVNPGVPQNTAISAYDSNGDKTTVQLSFSRAATPENTWSVTASIPNGTATSPAAQTLTFNGDATVNTPTELTVAGTSPGGGNINFTLDISTMTQYDGSLHEVFYDFDGNSDATMTGIEFTPEGYIVGNFSDATQHKLYMLPVATFSNPDALDPKNGNVYAESPGSGTASLHTAQVESVAMFLPNTYESSNVELQDEFTRMLVTQQAYNSAANVFRTVDEMTTVARDLKR